MVKGDYLMAKPKGGKKGSGGKGGYGGGKAC
jgi:hypothetical protein